MSHPSSSQTGRSRGGVRRWVPYFLLFSLLSLTSIAAFYIRQTSLENERLLFQSHIDEISSAVMRRMESQVALLRATRGLFASGEVLTRGRFSALVGSLRVAELYPGIQSVGFILRVPLEEKEKLIDSMRRQGIANFDIRPPGERAEYYPVVFVEPESSVNLRVLGFDLYAEPVRSETMNRSRDTGGALMSGRVRLLQETGDSTQPGFVLFIPVYREGEPPRTLEDRRAALLGFVAAAFRARDVLSGLLGSVERRDVAFRIYASDREDPDALLYESAKGADLEWRPRHTGVLKIGVTDRIWTLSVFSLPAFESADADSYILVILTGALLSGVLFLVARAQIRTTEAVERSALSLMRSQAALKESEQQYRELVELSPEAIFIQCEGKFVYVNPAMVRLLGASDRSELVGADVLDTVHPDFKEVVRERMRVLREEKKSVPLIEQKLLRADGKIVEAEVVASPFVYKGKPAAQVIARDITLRRELETQLLQSQKMEAIGRLAGGVAHDFNNLLTAIIGYTDFLKAAFQPNDPSLQYAEEIAKAGKRAAELTSQLLAFSRKQVLQPKILDPGQIIRESTNMLRRLIGEDVVLVTKLDPSLGKIRLDQGQFDQVLMNLAVNARDAMPKGGKLSIEATNTYLDQEYASSHFNVQPGPYVVVAVSDTGMGMDALTRSRIFEPFFTTKGKGKGTGLGLSTVYGIVRQNGGNIWVYSEAGEGTTFKIYLPRASDDAEEIQPPPPVESEARGTETILLVEDDRAVRRLAQKTLRLRGYSVLEAGDSNAALVRASEHRGPIHMLVSDVILPGANGRELAEKLLSRYQDLKVLYISGYTEDAVLYHGRLEPGTDFLSKPFTTNDLARKVREVLDR